MAAEVTAAIRRLSPVHEVYLGRQSWIIQDHVHTVGLALLDRAVQEFELLRQSHRRPSCQAPEGQPALCNTGPQGVQQPAQQPQLTIRLQFNEFSSMTLLLLYGA